MDTSKWSGGGCLSLSTKWGSSSSPQAHELLQTPLPDSRLGGSIITYSSLANGGKWKLPQALKHRKREVKRWPSFLLTFVESFVGLLGHEAS